MNFANLLARISALDTTSESIQPHGASQMSAPSKPITPAGGHLGLGDGGITAASSPITRTMEGGMEECGDDMPPAPRQQDNVNMNVTMSGQGKGGIADLIDVLKNIENRIDHDEPQHAPDDRDMLVGDEEETDEGNEFSGALVKARQQGKKEFEVDGKEYPVKEDPNEEVGQTGFFAEEPDGLGDHVRGMVDDFASMQQKRQRMHAELQRPGLTFQDREHIRTALKALEKEMMAKHGRTHEGQGAMDMDEPDTVEPQFHTMGDDDYLIGDSILGNKNDILRLAGLKSGPDDNVQKYSPAEETYANEPNPRVDGIEHITQTGDDLHAKGAYKALKVNGGENPGMNEALVNRLSSLYHEIKNR